MNTSNIATASTVASQLIRNNFFVPCVPLSVSSNLVATGTLAKNLSAVISEISPDLVKTSFADFTEIQQKKAELRVQTEECTVSIEALLDVCLLNIEDLFSNLAAYLIATGLVTEDNENQNAIANAKISLQLVHDYSSAVGFEATDYCEGGVILSEKLFDLCMDKVKVLQKKWQDNHFQSMELALQLQRDTVFGAAATCLLEICQDGLDNQVTLEPTPTAQEDALGALATCADFPFSGVWPQLRERVIGLGYQGNTANADIEGGV